MENTRLKTFITATVLTTLSIVVTVLQSLFYLDIKNDTSNIGLALLFPIIIIVMLVSLAITIAGTTSSAITISSNRKAVKITSIICLILNLICLGFETFYIFKFFTTLF